METLHRSGCSPDIDPVELQDEVAARGLEGCVDCHGNNGVSE
jgi:mono/diheme cytochrome c family protein